MQEFNNILKMLSSRNVLDYEDIIKQYFEENEYNDKILNQILKIKNPIIYSNFANLMQYKIDIYSLDKKRDIIIQNIIKNDIDDNKEIFSFFKDVNPTNYQDYNLFIESELDDIKRAIKKGNLYDELKNISNKWLCEYIVYYFFHDNYYNFLVNLNQMIKYIRSVNVLLISKGHLEFYNKCHDLSKMSFRDKIDFFNKYCNVSNIQEMFYDDMRIVKNHSYQNLVSSISSLNNVHYNDELSKKNSYPVYYLNGEKFNAFIRYINPNEGRGDFEYNKYVNNNLDKEGYSFSYIGDKNIGNIGKYGDGFILLYDNIKPNNIMHVHHDDSGSSSAFKDGLFISRKINEIHTPNTLLMDTKFYNEIVIKKELNGILPSALVCFDEIKEKDLQFAKKYHLPIVLINSKKYYQSDGYTDFNDYDTYSI